MLSKIEETRKSFDLDFSKISNLNELEELRIKFLGRKGLVAQLFESLKDVSKEDKRATGQSLNQLKIHTQSKYDEKNIIRFNLGLEQQQMLKNKWKFFYGMDGDKFDSV